MGTDQLSIKTSGVSADERPKHGCVQTGSPGVATSKRMKTETNPSSYYRTILNTMPLPVFVVDDDVRILDFNEAAAKLLAAGRGEVLHRRGGEALHCIHAHETPGGCGHSEACRNCVIRNAVGLAAAGHRVNQHKTRLELRTACGTVGVDILVTAAPMDLEGQRRTLLILENISELLALRELLPICAGCKSIRDDQQYWQKLESYMQEHLHLDFTHGLCPDCTARLYPDLFPKPAATPAPQSPESQATPVA